MECSKGFVIKKNLGNSGINKAKEVPPPHDVLHISSTVRGCHSSKIYLTAGSFYMVHPVVPEFSRMHFGNLVIVHTRSLYFK